MVILKGAKQRLWRERIWLEEEDEKRDREKSTELRFEEGWKGYEDKEDESEQKRDD